MIVQLLTATWDDPASVTPPDTYVFAGENALDRANVFSMHLIAQYAEGRWEEYRAASVKEFRDLVDAHRYEDARSLWNEMSSFQLTIEDAETKEGEDPKELALPNFEWPDDE